MKCFKCGENIIIPDKAYINLESYNVGGSVLVSSECCGAGYNVKMNITYNHTLYKGEEKEDNWGTEIK